MSLYFLNHMAHYHKNFCVMINVLYENLPVSQHDVIVLPICLSQLNLFDYVWKGN